MYNERLAGGAGALPLPLLRRLALHESLLDAFAHLIASEALVQPSGPLLDIGHIKPGSDNG